MLQAFFQSKSITADTFITLYASVLLILVAVASADVDECDKKQWPGKLQNLSMPLLWALQNAHNKR